MSSVADITIGRLLGHAVAQARLESPRTVSLLAELTGRRLRVEISGTPLSLLVKCDGQTLHLDQVATFDAAIRGAPLSLLALAGGDPQAVIARGDVTIEGDAQIAEQFRELGMRLRPDLEAGLSGLFGRSAAHVAMLGLRAARDWVRSSVWTATENIAEYLAHERGDLVSRAEAEHFVREVDQLREQLDRLATRLSHLEERTNR